MRNALGGEAHEVRGIYSMTMSETIGVCANKVPPMTARQRLIVVLLLGANFMMSADFSILNIALPVVGEAVGLSVDNLPWVSTAFALPAAGLSLLFGRLGDLYADAASFSPAYSSSRPRRFLAVFRPSRLCSSPLGRYKGWRVQ
jgi:MFS family permease